MARLFALVLSCGLALLVGLPLLRALVALYPCLWTPGQCGGDAYTREYFADLTPIAETLASRRYSEGVVLQDRNGFDCTFAIAALDNRAPPIPPASRKTGVLDMEWGWGWHAVTTLSAKDHEDLRSLLAICGVYWSKKTQDLLTEALGNRKMLVAGRAPYREVNLYLPAADEHGLAARIRFGE